MLLLIGNILGKNKSPTPIDGVHPETAMIEEGVETALGVDQEDTPENAVKEKKISKPKPKKSKKKK